MKLNPETQDIYAWNLKKLVRITAIFTSDDDANMHCADNPDEGVIACFEDGPENFVLIAKLNDPGIIKFTN